MVKTNGRQTRILRSLWPISQCQIFRHQHDTSCGEGATGRLVGPCLAATEHYCQGTTGTTSKELSSLEVSHVASLLSVIAARFSSMNLM